jgi:HPt (histidine-containing phosphotransfer) domain-containing protein
MTGGTLMGYRKVLNLFCSDIRERISLLQTTLNVESLPLFVTHVHAIKSAAAAIGAAEISTEAALLEAAGIAGNMAVFEEHISGFMEHLEKLEKNLEINTISALNSPKICGEESRKGDTFHELIGALKSHNTYDIDRILEELIQKSPDDKTKDALEKISDQVLMAEFDNALELANELLD